MSIRVLTVIGTRPEAIKLAPVVAELRRRNSTFSVCVAATGQHDGLLRPMFETFSLDPDFELGVMSQEQDPRDVLSRVLLGLRPVLEAQCPDLVLVQGDTTSSLAAALCAAHQQIPVGHVEAGLRSGCVRAPFPEEYNRRLTTHLTAYHFPPTEAAKRHLLAEGVPEQRITVTGNTVVDALRWALTQLETHPVDLSQFTPGLDWRISRVVLVTGHRRESFGEGFEEICTGLDRLAERNPDVQIVYPVHLNPRVRDVVSARLGARPNIRLLPPMRYLPFVQMMACCRFIVTDSGGIQEEAASLRKPVLVMRDRTERPEAIEAGVARLVGTDAERIVEQCELLLADTESRATMPVENSPYGDGLASGRIADFLERNAPFTLR